MTMGRLGDRAAEQPGEPGDGGRVLGDGLGRRERCPPWRDEGEGLAGEGQCRFGYRFGEVSSLVGGLDEVPAVHEGLDHAQLQGDDAGDGPDRHVHRLLEAPRGCKRVEKPACRFPVGAGRVPSEVIDLWWWRHLIWRRWGLAAESAGDGLVACDEVVDQVAYRPALARGRR
jgi:hypothetical protein